MNTLTPCTRLKNINAEQCLEEREPGFCIWAAVGQPVYINHAFSVYHGQDGHESEGGLFMEETMKETIKKFNDEFMFVWYKGREHIIARQEYERVFSMLLPKYFVPLPNQMAGSLDQTEKH